MSSVGYTNHHISRIRDERPDEYEQLERFTGKLSATLRTTVSSIEIELYFSSFHVLLFENLTLLIGFTDNLAHDNVVGRHLTTLTDAVKHTFGDNIATYIMNADGVVYDIEKKESFCYSEFTSKRSAQIQEKAASSSFRSEYTFDNFIVGKQNQFAYAAARAVASNPSFDRTPGKDIYNPLFIHGGSGLGKTHLLYAIMNDIAANRPELKMLYKKGVDFTNELITALQNSDMSKFREKYRYLDVLLVDDIQFIEGKQSTQEEFFHTFNALHEVGKQIILASDRPPQEMYTLEERLMTRFSQGLIADIQAPDYETRVAIIQKKAQSMNIELSDDVTTYIANNVKKSIRQLEGAVKKLSAYSAFTGCELTLDIVPDVLRDLLTESAGNVVNINTILSYVANYYSVSEDDILGTARKANIANARQVVMYITRELTQMSLSQIGAVMDKNHTTVMHSANKVEKMMNDDLHFKRTIEEMMKNIKEG